MSCFRNFVLAAVASAVLSLGSAAQAGILYDNLSQESLGSVFVATSQFGPLADSFSTGSTATYFQSVLLSLLADDPKDGESFTVSLRSDSDTSPGAALASATFNDSILTTSLKNYTFPTSGSILLAANTRYWIEVSGTANSSARWSRSSNSSGTGVAGEYNFLNGKANSNSSVQPFQMQVNTIPEPGTLTLGAIGTPVLAIARRRLARP
jgi:hypothetical protein